MPFGISPSPHVYVSASLRAHVAHCVAGPRLASQGDGVNTVPRGYWNDQFTFVQLRYEFIDGRFRDSPMESVRNTPIVVGRTFFTVRELGWERVHVCVVNLWAWVLCRRGQRRRGERVHRGVHGTGRCVEVAWRRRHGAAREEERRRCLSKCGPLPPYSPHPKPCAACVTQRARLPCPLTAPFPMRRPHLAGQNAPPPFRRLE